MSDEILEVRNSAFKVTPLIPNPWSATSMSGGVIIISLITLAASIMINSNTQVAYGLGTQFTPGTYPYTGLEPNTRAFLENLQQKEGPPIYSLSPQDARAVLSGLQANTPAKLLPADNRV